MTLEDEAYQKLLGFALNYVSIRLRSEEEIRTYLSKKIQKWKLPRSFLEKIMERLQELGYVDDVKFALAFIDSRNRFRPKGVMVIKMELKRRGVGVDAVSRALELSSVEGLGEEADLARIAATKKLRGLQRYTELEKHRKLYSFLVRRGFPSHIVSTVIDELLSKGLQ